MTFFQQFPLPSCSQYISYDRLAKRHKPQFLSLLEQHIGLDEIIPVTFYNHFYASTGRTRKYPLHALLWALIIQRIFSIPTDQLLLTFLHYSRPLREFCGFVISLTLAQDLLTGNTFGDNKHFSCAYIPLNKRSSLADADSFINEEGIPCCPNDSSLPLKKEGNNTAFLKNGIDRQKFICPMTTWDKCDDGMRKLYMLI